MIMWNRNVKKKQITWQLCYKDTGSFVVYVKAKDIYIDIPKGVEKRHNISSYEKDHHLKEKIKKVNGLIKDKIVGKIMTDFAALIPETFGYSIDDNDDKINAKGTKKCVMK